MRAHHFIAVAATVLISATSAQAAGRSTPACAAQDLRAINAIEQRGMTISASNEQLAAAGMRFLEARGLCLSGQENEAVALYQSVIDFDAPIQNAGK